MLNAAPEPIDPDADDAAVEAAVRAGPIGAIALAGTATAIVVALWLAFYLIVFLARVTTP